MQEQISAFNQAKVSLVESLKTELNQKLQAIMQKMPTKIQSLGWTQYTPYWCDGDICEFGVNLDLLYINGEYEDGGEIDCHYPTTYDVVDGQYKDIPNPNYDAACGEPYEEFKGVLESIPQEFFKEIYGDHLTITVYRDRVDVEAFDHD